MKRFFVEFAVDTPICIGTLAQQQTTVPADEFRLALRNSQVVVFDSLPDRPAPPLRLSRGLQIHMYLDAPNPEEAAKLGKEITESVLVNLSFASSAACPPASIRRLYDATPTAVPRVYRQWFAYDLPGTLQQRSQWITDALVGALDRAQNTQAFRALVLLRKGLSEDNWYDQFTAYWMALEALESELRKRLPKVRIAEEHRYDKGIMRFFHWHLYWMPGRYWRLKRTRDGMFHGTAHYTRNFTKRVSAYVPVLRLAVVDALAVVLDLPPRVGSVVKRQIPCAPQPLRGYCEVRITLEAVPSIREIGKQPFLEFTQPDVEFGMNSDGGLEVTFNQAIGKTRLHNANLHDDKYTFAIDLGPRRKNLTGVHRKASAPAANTEALQDAK